MKSFKRVLCSGAALARRGTTKLMLVGGLFSGAATFTPHASAAVDVTAVVTTIGDAAVAGAAIGVAILGMYYGIKLYKWVKGAG